MILRAASRAPTIAVPAGLADAMGGPVTKHDHESARRLCRYTYEEYYKVDTLCA